VILFRFVSYVDHETIIRREIMKDYDVDPIYRAIAGRINLGDSKYIPKILAKMANLEQAKIINEMPVSSTDELVERLGMSKELVEKHVHELIEKGLVLPRKKGGLRTFYSATELKDTAPSNPKFDDEYGDEFFELWYEWYDSNEAREWWKNKPVPPNQTMPFMRIIPKWKSIEGVPGKLPCDDVEELIRENQDKMALNICSCRRVAKNHAPKEIPDQVCLVFNEVAEYCIERGTGKEIGMEEALEVLKSMEDFHYMHLTYNGKKIPRLIGNCGDYCIVFRWSDKGDIADCAKSRFQAVVDLDKCKGCGNCIEACILNVAKMKYSTQHDAMRSEILSEKCWGCGNCVVKCPHGSITMKVVRPSDHIPDEYQGVS
jgi:NAD-dependent dihydropyrimidine dehydrogenase PreA subunit/DNA-binding transcriptional ArsR family regulator